MRHSMTHAHDCLIASESDARDLRLAGKETLGLVEKMSRSHRYNPITSFVKVASEKKDKQRWHRAWRARQRAVLNAAVRITESEDVEEAFAGFNLILPREVSDVWVMEKDGKVRFSPVKYRHEEWWKKIMRK